MKKIKQITNSGLSRCRFPKVQSNSKSTERAMTKRKDRTGNLCYSIIPIVTAIDKIYLFDGAIVEAASTKRKNTFSKTNNISKP